MIPPITTPQRPALSPDYFLRRYKTERRRKKMEPYYQTMIEVLPTLSEPLAIYDEYPISSVTELSPWLRPDTVAVTLGLCSLGLHLDAWAQELVQVDLISAVILEEVALAWIVAITREIHGHIRSEGKKRGIITGPAYRPGVGRWPLDTQLSVFTRLPAERIGVSLDKNLQMRPIQSTSLIIPMRLEAANQRY